MKNEHYTTTFEVDQTPSEVFDAVTNVRGWWSEDIEGSTKEAGDEFAYRHNDVHRCKLKLTEAIPGKRVVWLVLDNYFKFTKDATEWTGKQLIFEITTHGEKTQLRFTHDGLGRWYECFDICSDAWSFYIGTSLRGLIEAGTGEPNSSTTQRTEKERELAKAG